MVMPRSKKICMQKNLKWDFQFVFCISIFQFYVVFTRCCYDMLYSVSGKMCKPIIFLGFHSGVSVWLWIILLLNRKSNRTLIYLCLRRRLPISWMLQKKKVKNKKSHLKILKAKFVIQPLEQLYIHWLIHCGFLDSGIEELPVKMSSLNEARKSTEQYGFYTVGDIEERERQRERGKESEWIGRK